MITIVDYGMGNLRSVRGALERTGHPSGLAADPAGIGRAAFLLLPGVGAFGDAVRMMDDRGLREPILRHAAEGKPLLGICLGMQLLFGGSEESPGAPGLGLLAGTVRRFAGVRVPHIGWNDVRWLYGARDGETTSCYFVHSYFVHASPAAAGVTVYGTEFVSAVHEGSVAGFQFHPEKSHDAGLRVLDRTIRRLRGAPPEGS